MKKDTIRKTSTNTEVHENELTVNGKINRRQTIKKVGIITVTAASMITLLGTKQALATSPGVYPDAPGSSGNFS